MIRFTDRPEYCPREWYDECLQELSQHLGSLAGIRSVYRFGNISIPGISDLDILLVFENETSCIASGLEQLSAKHKILFNYSPTDEIYAIDASISRIKKYGKLMKETRKEEIFSFQNENFIFEYEIGRLYKNNKNIKKQFTQSDKKLFTESLKKGNEIKNFYLDMINENIKIFLK